MINGDVAPMQSMVGNNKNNTLIITAGIRDKWEAVTKKTFVINGIKHKQQTAANKTASNICSLFSLLLNFPPIKYPLAKPPKVIAITELQTYKLLPKKGANNFAPQISAAITEAPSTNEIVYNLFL
jgi:hypothetical protein